MSRSYRTVKEKFNIIKYSFNNPEISIAEICRNHGIAVSLFYKWKEQFIEGKRRDWKETIKLLRDYVHYSVYL